jgi:nucleoside-diphosphate-sugar epimerase
MGANACSIKSLPQVLAEREAWRLAAVHGLALTTILPNFVMGPLASPLVAHGLSVQFMKVSHGVGCAPGEG